MDALFSKCVPVDTIHWDTGSLSVAYARVVHALTLVSVVLDMPCKHTLHTHAVVHERAHARYEFAFVYTYVARFRYEVICVRAPNAAARNQFVYAVHSLAHAHS
jgi:hypothetical protein